MIITCILRNMEITKEGFLEICADLEAGKIRVAEKLDGEWKVNSWIKEAILCGFRLGTLTAMPEGQFDFIDKDTIPVRHFTVDDKVRIVPGGSSVRRGAYLAPSVIMMPPAYVNIGAYVDEGSMIDSHALVGSCAQVGKNVHIAAAAQIGGVLEPVGAMPVIIEDNVFIGGNCGIYEGVLVKEGAVLGSGVIINRSTAIYDAINGGYIRPDETGRLAVPGGAVVVAGSRPVRKGPGAEDGIHVYTPVIVKYRDSKTDASVELEDLLR